MNKRQAKKKESNQLFCSYSISRKISRASHENIISLARKKHLNYWNLWKRGYPNRFPYKKWYKSM